MPYRSSFPQSKRGVTRALAAVLTVSSSSEQQQPSFIQQLHQTYLYISNQHEFFFDISYMNQKFVNSFCFLQANLRIDLEFFNQVKNWLKQTYIVSIFSMSILCTRCCCTENMYKTHQINTMPHIWSLVKCSSW